ncbi:hypothetical protein [Paenibacillus radicis (ex Gao et al. 2016)]|uniref:Uncharacterized protein n=1 Tax=Paenibacillus radicis (ex Gao et al. 2016) TaxID=1737354 RepID=A0A917HJT8_9BACL|nr:hypothetical protein [Paenibacillus radicis (ex Gao et al. 2016)]GGG81653.1 hypothetical protein GCM10010918_43700 [Paenibacillus radicis (ex Gao et al. 2016)]
MRTKSFVALLTIALFVAAAPAYAAQPEDQQSAEKGADAQSHSSSHEGWKSDHEHHHGNPPSAAQIEEHRLAKLRYMAKYFGISTEGKTADQLKNELKAAKVKDKDKWEAFKAEHQAKRLEHLKRVATEHGISTEGKSADQLLDELRKQRRAEEKKQTVPSQKTKVKES